jgi:AraC-like DNA-binding protein
MLTMIASQHGPDLASAVAEGILHSPIRHHSENQRMSLPARIGARHPKLVSIIEKMEDNLEDPLSPSLLAKQADLSTRQLERLFRRYLDRSPKRYYLELRLWHWHVGFHRRPISRNATARFMVVRHIGSAACQLLKALNIDYKIGEQAKRLAPLHHVSLRLGAVDRNSMVCVYAILNCKTLHFS